jgi:GPH family glycoside/pentoside/hexuronide:cation symporter
MTLSSALSIRQLLQYGFIAFPIAFAGFPLYILAPDFFATTYSLSLSSLGAALLGLRLFDAIQDPLIGHLSDRYRHRIRLVMGTSAAALVASIFCLFNVHFFSPLLGFSVCIGVAVTAYSILTINLNSIGALWSAIPHDQTRISAVRESMALVGLILAVSLPSLIGSFAPHSQTYIVFGLILLILMSLGTLLFLKGYPYLTSSKPTLSSDSRFTLLPSYSQFKPSFPLICTQFLSMFASSFPAVLIIFFIRDLLHAEAYSGLFLILYFLSGALFIPIWKKLSTRYGKTLTWAFAMGVASLSFIWAFFLSSGDILAFGLICIFSGSALGADLLLPPALLGEQIHDSGTEEHASTLYAWLGLSAKLALALASGLAFPLIEYFGFRPASLNTSTALFGLRFTYALIPCTLKICCAALLIKQVRSQKPLRQGAVYET